MIEELKKRIEALEKYVEDRKVQQVSFPIDDISKIIIREFIPNQLSKTGTGSASTQGIVGPFPITVPAQPSGTLVVQAADGSTYNLLVA